MVSPATNGQGDFRDLWLLSLVTSITTVVVFFAAANIIMGRNGLPLGYDSYGTYIPWINQALALGPLQFAATHHYIEVLYPVIGSFAVRLGMTADQFEVYAPIVMAVATVGATAYLARRFEDQRVGILSVAFAAGWFAIYRMGADYHGQFLAFPLLLVATGLLVRISKTAHLARDVVLFGLFVGLATLAHVETTAVFVAVWVLAFAIFGIGRRKGTRRLLIIIGVSLAVALPVLYEYPLGGITYTGLPYPELPTFWLEVLGPEAAFVILGVALFMSEAGKPGSELLAKLTLVWTVFSFVILSGWYAFHWFNLAISDRTFLMLPIPLLSAEATVWLGEKGEVFAGHRNFLTLLVIVIPVLSALSIFLYLVPMRFHYYPPFLP